MSGITLEQAKEHLNTWLEAEKAIAAGQSYTIGNRTLTRATLFRVREQIAFWRREVARLESGSQRKVTRVIPRDL